MFSNLPIRGALCLSPPDRERFIFGVEHAVHLVAELLVETTDDVLHLLRRLDDRRRLSPEVATALGANDWTAPLRPGRRPGQAA
jgi:hypothetical protein